MITPHIKDIQAFIVKPPLPQSATEIIQLSAEETMRKQKTLGTLALTTLNEVEHDLGRLISETHMKIAADRKEKISILFHHLYSVRDWMLFIVKRVR